MESIIERIEKEIAHWQPAQGSSETGVVRATGDGIAEMAVARVYEERRPEEVQNKDAIAKYTAVIGRSLDALERARFAEPPTIGEIAVACAIGYLDFRLPELNWRDTRPHLRDWYEGFAKYPSMQATWPANLT